MIFISSSANIPCVLCNFHLQLFYLQKGRLFMLGERMKKVRQEQFMSLDDVAELVGKSASTLSRYENNLVHKFDLDVVEKVADAIGTSSAYLLGMTDNSHYIPQNKWNKYLEDKFLETILVTDDEMDPEIPQDAYVQIRKMKPNEELSPGYFYYVEFDNKKCFRMAIDDPDEGVSLMPHTMSERRIAYDKEYAKIIGKVVSITELFLD